MTEPKIFLSGSSLDWYRLTEHTRHTLNQTMVKASKRISEEWSKLFPRKVVLEGYMEVINIVSALTKDPKNFSSLNRMEEVCKECVELAEIITKLDRKFAVNEV